MPLYEFSCRDCDIRFEEFSAINADKANVICPNGHSHIRRVFSTPTIVFEGDGFYVSDSRSKLDKPGSNSRQHK